jgi:glycosyltransferase involved in cell wall biosynthesis
MKAELYIISFFFIIFYAGLILYYRQSWLEIPSFKLSSTDHIFSTLITVIIPARNEEDNITACLQSILAQDYPKNLFEVIVVDDHSTDGTAEQVRSFTSENIRLISLKDHTNNDPLNSYKKKAIEIAVQQSTGNLIVTTDADCVVSTKWLSRIASFYEQYCPVFIAGRLGKFGSYQWKDRKVK